MISKNAQRYCLGALANVQNYAAALTDQKRTWHLHHKREFQPDGKGFKIVESVTLRRRGEYLKRPASELVFLPPGLHSWIHVIARKTPRYLRDLVKPLIQKAYGLGSRK